MAETTPGAQTAATKRSTAAKKAAATRARKRAADARTTIADGVEQEATEAATAAKRSAAELAAPVHKARETAERVVLTQLGVALVARDTAKETVDSVRTVLSKRSAREKELEARRRRVSGELARFEQRGTAARDDVLAKVTSELDGLTHKASARRETVLSRTGLVSARGRNLVQSGITAGSQAAAKVQERVASIV